ncbi:MAG: hypothetical protein ACM3L9_05445 [Deltaproteobacteria bacterium]
MPSLPAPNLALHKAWFLPFLVCVWTFVGFLAVTGGTLAGPGPDVGPRDAREVVIGAYVHDIQEIDFRTQSYAVDLYVWFRWRNPEINPAKTLEFMNRFAPNAHVRNQMYEPPKVLPDGTMYAVVRNQGRFSTRLAVSDYPFDKQELRIELEDSESGSALLAYVLDHNALTLSPDIDLPGFRIGKPRMEIRDHIYPTNFGNPTVGEKEAYSRAVVIVPIERPLTALAVKTFLPILLIMTCAGLILWIRPAYIDARVGLSVTALLTLLLTLVALQLASGRFQPDVDYLTLIDKIYLASFAFIILVLLRAVRASWRGDGDGGEQLVSRMDRTWFAAVVLLYVATVAVIAFLSIGS